MADITPIFILSLPRSGSTLLQRLIASDPSVATTPEPWVMLPFLYAMKDDGVVAEYDHALYRQGMRGFLSAVPGGAEEYRQELRRFALSLYKAAGGPGTGYFLDKTPRYSLVVDELLRVFPDAIYIFLFRQPLAVAASAIETFTGGRWRIHRVAGDLYSGLEHLSAAHEALGATAMTVHYEQLVTEPESVLTGLGKYLGLTLDTAIASRLPSWTFESPLGDQTGTRSYGQVSPDSLEKWPTTFASPVRRAWAHRYLDWIGADRLRGLGYDFAEVSRALDSVPTTLHGSLSDLVGVIRGRLLSVSDKLPGSWH